MAHIQGVMRRMREVSPTPVTALPGPEYLAVQERMAAERWLADASARASEMRFSRLTSDPSK